MNFKFRSLFLYVPKYTALLAISVGFLAAGSEFKVKFSKLEIAIPNMLQRNFRKCAYSEETWCIWIFGDAEYVYEIIIIKIKILICTTNPIL